MWIIIQKNNPIWYFDGTANINKKIPTQKDPHFFSMVCFDKQLRQLIPIFEFVTTDHSAFSLVTYLQQAKNLIAQKQYTPKYSFMIAPIIVVDFSWVMINSINEAYNKCSILRYLQWTFEIIVNQNESKEFLELITTRVYICAVHFLKTVVKKVKKYKDDKKNILFKMFVYAFTLIQNSISLDQLIVYLKNIHNIFCNKKFDPTVIFSINMIREELKTRGLNKINASHYLIDIDESKADLEKKQPKTNIDWFKDLHSSQEDNVIKNDSPFAPYFKNLISRFNNEIDDNGQTDFEKNPYFNIEIFEVIKNFLYLAPLWTGIMLEQCRKQFILSFKEIFSRLTNNPVEGYFGHLKHNILKFLKNVLTSELASHLYLRLKAKYIEFYMCKFEDGRPKIVKRLKSKKNIKSNKKILSHVWKKNIKCKREKGVYFKNISNFELFDLFDCENIIETADFVEAFDVKQNFEIKNDDQMDINEKENNLVDPYETNPQIINSTNGSIEKEMDINEKNNNRPNSNKSSDSEMEMDEKKSPVIIKNPSAINKNQPVIKKKPPAINKNPLVINKNQPAFNKNLSAIENKMETDPENKYYFLRIKNIKNGCYANSILQGLLSLGETFFNAIFCLPVNFKVNESASVKNSVAFWNELRLFISEYKSFSTRIMCSSLFRGIIDSISKINFFYNLVTIKNLHLKHLDIIENDKKYKTNQQQDSFDFVAAILQSCETLFSLFTYQVIL